MSYLCHVNENNPFQFIMKTKLLFLLLILSMTGYPQKAWQLCNTSGNVGFLKDICFVEDGNWTIGYAISYEGDLLKTSDSGNIWIVSSTGYSMLTGVSFISEQTGYISLLGSNSVIKTIDGGQAWTVSLNDPIGFDRVTFKDTANGIATSTNYTKYTGDGGQNWSMATQDYGYWDLDYAGGDTYFGCSLLPGTVGKSTDNGATWTTVFNWNVFGNAVDFYSEMHGIFTGDAGNVAVTHDGGSTWGTNQMPGTSFFCAGMWDPDTMFISGIPGNIYKSVDGGANWVLDTNVVSEMRSFFCTPIYVYICGDSGKIFRKQLTALPGISVDPTFLDFDTTVVNHTSTMQMTVKNIGEEILSVTDITSNIPVFEASPTSFTLAANQKQTVDVTFTPDEVNSFYGILSILNNSPTPLVEVICTGIGIWPVGINQVNRNEKPYSLYPNPVKDHLYLALNLSEGKVISIDICDLSGKVQTVINATWIQRGNQQLDLATFTHELKAGIYIMHLRIGENSYSEKLVILK